MKKIYTLIVLTVISACMSAQSIDKSTSPIIKKSLSIPNAQRSMRMSSPDTTGLVNYSDFLPQFAPMGSPTLYSYTSGGYLYGNNGDSMTVCAQGYANLNNYPVRILGVLMWFAAKESDAGSSPSSKVVAKAWGVSPNQSYNTDGSATINNTVANWPGPRTAYNAPDAAVDILFTDIDTSTMGISFLEYANVLVGILP